MVEQNAAVQRQRLAEAEHGLTAMQALWGQCLQQVLERHVDPDQIAAALPRMHLELVLTAHPTEAKRTDRPRASSEPVSAAGQAREPDVDAVRAARHPRGDQDGALAAVADRRDLPAEARCGRRAAEHHALPVRGVSRGPAGAGSPPAPDVGVRGARRRQAPRAAESAAVQPEHVGGRRPRRSPVRHRGGHASDAGRPAPARPAAAPASAGRSWPGNRASPIACSRRRRRCAIASAIWPPSSASADGRRSRASRKRPGGNWSA